MKDIEEQIARSHHSVSSAPPLFAPPPVPQRTNESDSMTSKSELNQSLPASPVSPTLSKLRRTNSEKPEVSTRISVESRDSGVDTGYFYENDEEVFELKSVKELRSKFSADDQSTSVRRVSNSWRILKLLIAVVVNHSDFRWWIACFLHEPTNTAHRIQLGLPH